MKIIKHAILLIFGLSLSAFGLFAFQWGLDPDPGLGKGRMLTLFLGIIFLTIFIDLRFGAAKTEIITNRICTRFTAMREQLFNLLHIPVQFRSGLGSPVRNGLINLGIFLAGVTVIASYTWFATAGTWKIWPESSSYYNLLANAFIQGQVSLDIEVPQQLLALTDPYEPAAREGIDYLWDASLYNGKYYIYWGPVPAVIIAALKLIHPQNIGDNLIVFAAAVGLFIFQTLLMTRIWKRFFQRLPAWTLLIGIFLAGLVIPINWMIHRPEIYEAAIMSAQFFLMAGLYFAYLAFENCEISSLHLVWASVFWVCAVASRIAVIFVVIFLVSYALIGIVRQHGIRWTAHFKSLILALCIPMILGMTGLAWYNAARFGSVFDFGFEHQLTMYNFRKNETSLFSGRYIFTNAPNYLLAPPERIKPFPYFKVKTVQISEAFGKITPQAADLRVTGLTYVLPFLVFAFAAQRTIMEKFGTGENSNRESKEPIYWIMTAVGWSVVIAITGMFSFFYTTMRYYADVTPMLIVLAVIGFWAGYQAVESDPFVQFVYAGFGILLAGISIIMPNMLALLSSQRINYYSPQVLPALDALFKSFFSG